MSFIPGSGIIPTVSQGIQASRLFTDTTNLITLVAVTTGANHTTFRKTNGTAAYTPSGSKSFYVYSIKVYANTTGGLILATIAQSDNDVGFNSAITALTNPVYLAGYNGGVIPAAAPAAGGTFTAASEPILFTIANAKFLSTDTLNVTIFVNGYEV